MKLWNQYLQEIYPRPEYIKKLLKVDSRKAIEYLKKSGIHDSPENWLKHIELSVVKGHDKYSHLKSLAGIQRHTFNIVERIAKGNPRNSDMKSLDFLWTRWQQIGDILRTNDPHMIFKLYGIKPEQLSKLHRDIETLIQLLYQEGRKGSKVTSSVIRAQAKEILNSGTLQKMSGSSKIINMPDLETDRDIFYKSWRNLRRDRSTSDPEEVLRRLKTGT